MGTVALITGILQLVPAAFSTYANIRADLSTEDQAQLDALVDAAKAAALASVATADAALDAAAKS